MDLCKEDEMRQCLIKELNGFRHNLYHDSKKYRMTIKVLQEAKKTEVKMVDLLYKYADYFVDCGIVFHELFEGII